MPMSTIRVATPIGAVHLLGDDKALALVSLHREVIGDHDAPSALLREAAAQIEAWFAGRLTQFDLPLHPARTERGAALRAGIAAIPHGATASYGEVAKRVGSGPRAVGQACRRNPFPILIPCHRVLGAGQSIGYYSAGDGVATKRWLLAHEQQVANATGRRNHG